MAKKTLGYAELYWTCPNCEGINPGPEKTCRQCGAPQPEDVQFEQAERLELLDDEAVKERVAAGPDIHCPYCGTRNPGDAQTCTQCGGDIASGERRESGRVVGAFKTGPAQQIPCPHCGAENPDTATNCAQCGGNLKRPKATERPAAVEKKPSASRRWSIWLLAPLLVVCCCIAAVFVFLALRTESLSGTVRDVYWEYAIEIEALAPEEYSDWRDQIPADAEVLSCEQDVRSIENQPVPNSEEVCGTPYSVDSGSGYAEVVQDCEYHVYDDYCSYTVLEWQVSDTVTLSGHDFAPHWPDPVYDRQTQRLGDYTETYTVYFDTSQGDDYTYHPDDLDEFQKFEIGSEWNLEVNTFGGVVSVSR